MFEKIDCIALRTVKYNDRNSILSVYTRQHGRMSLLLPAGAGRSAARLRAITMPLGAFECIVDLKPGKEIFSMRDVRPAAPSPGLSPVKASMSIFIADLLSSLLREPQQDEPLFAFLKLTIDRINSSDSHQSANLHICFLLKLQHFLGIEPDWSTYTPGGVFDLNDGIFRASPPPHRRFLPSAEAAAAYALRRMNFRTARVFRMSRADRNAIIDRLIDYYHIHFPTLGSLPSLEILRVLFD